MLKTITNSKKLDASSKIVSPFDRDLSGVVGLEVSHFEKLGDTIFAVGTDVMTGEQIRITREWSRSVRNENENPILAAAERVRPGGIMMFTGVDKLRTANDKNSYHSDGFTTISSDPDRGEGAQIRMDSAVFVDEVNSDEADKVFQIYNVVEAERSKVITSPESFVDAFSEIFSTSENLDLDGAIIRAYSEEEGIASSIRVSFSAELDFRKTMEGILKAEHSIDMVGSSEGTYEVSGKLLMDMLADESSSTQWEIIPVKGVRNDITNLRYRDFEKRSTAKAKELFASSLAHRETPMLGYRPAAMGIVQGSTKNGKQYSSVRAFYNEPGEAQPLALVSTPHHNDLEAKFRVSVVYSEMPEHKEMDLLSYVKELAAQLDARNAEQSQAASTDPDPFDLDFMSEDDEVSEISGDFDFLDDEDDQPLKPALEPAPEISASKPKPKAKVPREKPAKPAQKAVEVSAPEVVAATAIDDEMPDFGGDFDLENTPAEAKVQEVEEDGLPDFDFGGDMSLDGDHDALSERIQPETPPSAEVKVNENMNSAEPDEAADEVAIIDEPAEPDFDMDFGGDFEISEEYEEDDHDEPEANSSFDPNDEISVSEGITGEPKGYSYKDILKEEKLASELPDTPTDDDELGVDEDALAQVFNF